MMSLGSPASAIGPVPLKAAQLQESLRYASDRDFDLRCSQFKTRETPAVEEQVQYLRQLMGEHRYISVELQDEGGRLKTAHITRLSDGAINVIVASEKLDPLGIRLSSIEGRFLADSAHLTVEQLQEQPAEDPRQVIEQIQEFMVERARRPAVLQLNPQGFVERDRNFVGGIVDTGGQNRYVEDMSVELANQGFQVVIVNRGGPSVREFMIDAERRDLRELEQKTSDLWGNAATIRRHAEASQVPATRQRFTKLAEQEARKAEQTAEALQKRKSEAEAAIEKLKAKWRSHDGLREGMHYRADGVDVLYVDDGFRVEGRPVFVPKEQLYDDFLHKQALPGPHFIPMARQLYAHLGGERFDFVIGHYADGGEVARLFVDMTVADSKVRPILWHIPHSTSPFKRDNETKDMLRHKDREENGKEKKNYRYLATLNLDNRAATEERFYETADLILHTSKAIHDSVRNFPVPTEQYALPPSVNTERFKPLDQEDNPENRVRTGPKFERLWHKLEDLAGRSQEDLQKCNVVLEISRTEQTKNKDVVMRAFCEAQEQLAEKGEDCVLIVNISDQATSLRRELCRLAAELNYSNPVLDEHGDPKRRIILFEAPTDYETSQLFQICDLYFTASSVEGFGMSAQQASACKKGVVGNELIPYVEQHLVGGVEKGATDYHVPAVGTVKRGPGGVSFPDGNTEAAAAAIVMYFADDRISPKKMGEQGYKIAMNFTWGRNLRQLMEIHGHVEYGADGRVPPRERRAGEEFVQ